MALAIAAVFWAAAFWVFLSRQSPIIADAVSFYDHLKFFIDNICRGVYPLWDPLWSQGSPNDFFLRRVGPFNPFLFLIIVPYKLGADYWTVFAAFITFYYFLGMAGFYAFAAEYLENKTAAVIAFLLLCFSSLGTRVFDSYIMMVMTPLLWLFYFALVFAKRGGRFPVLGMTFCAMLMLTTYVPFYFIVMAASGAVFAALIFPAGSLKFAGRVFGFAQKNPLLMILCLAALTLSCLPGYFFFSEAGRATFTLPLRHFNAADPHMLMVKADVTTYWAIPEDILYSSFYLEDLRLFDFSVFYIPLFAYILFFVGSIAKADRKTVFLALWTVFLLVLGSPYAFGLYDFLHRHIPFFKYFRNLHFFLWIGVLPLFILMVAAQFRQFLEIPAESPRRNGWTMAFIVLVHAGFAVFLAYRNAANFSTWGVLGLSFIFLSGIVKYRLPAFIIAGLCFAAIVGEPMEAFHHLSRKVPRNVTLSVYDQKTDGFVYQSWPRSRSFAHGKLLDSAPEARANPLYFGTVWYNRLWENVDFSVLRRATNYKFVLFDGVRKLDDAIDLKILETSWAGDANYAFVPSDTSDEFLSENPPTLTSKPLFVEGPGPLLRVLKYDPNSIVISTDLPSRKFLVYHDGYYPGWRAYIDGKPAPLFRANTAFKGLWLPPGRHETEFRYDKGWPAVLEILLIAIFAGILAMLTGFWITERKRGDYAG